MRLAFCLKDAVPMSAIEAGHVFLGFSKCGQFLLSYTQVSQVSSFIHCWLRLFWGFQDVNMSLFISKTVEVYFRTYKLNPFAILAKKIRLSHPRHNLFIIHCFEII